MEEQPITKILRDASLVSYIFDDQDPYVKYGLKKTTPSDFNADSNRYVLRIGFPDYPACPVGTDFTMLGFDEQTRQYVWLSTSMLNNSCLKRVEFNTLSFLAGINFTIDLCDKCQCLRDGKFLTCHLYAFRILRNRARYKFIF